MKKILFWISISFSSTIMSLHWLLLIDILAWCLSHSLQYYTHLLPTGQLLFILLWLHYYSCRVKWKHAGLQLQSLSIVWFTRQVCAEEILELLNKSHHSLKCPNKHERTEGAHTHTCRSINFPTQELWTQRHNGKTGHSFIGHPLHHQYYMDPHGGKRSPQPDS